MDLQAEMVVEVMMVSIAGKEEVNGIWWVPVVEPVDMEEKEEMVVTEAIQPFIIQTSISLPI